MLQTHEIWPFPGINITNGLFIVIQTQHFLDVSPTVSLGNVIDYFCVVVSFSDDFGTSTGTVVSMSVI